MGERRGGSPPEPSDGSPLELIARVPLFAELDPDELQAIASCVAPRVFTEGEDIFHIGEPGRSLYLVTEGTVQVHHPDREGDFELAQFGPGEFFGEMALLNDSPRSATARALEDGHALVLDKVDFRRILTASPEVALKILKAMSIRIRNADDLLQDLTNRSERDPLTGLRNRRAFAERIEEEIARTRRYGTRFSLLLLDFDDFRAVNERVGPEEGDRILAWVGRVLTEHTRASDVQFRREQDAFTVLCPSTDGAGAKAVASRLSALVGEARPPIEAEVTLSISTGTATCPDDAMEPGALQAAAGVALARGRE